MKPKNHKQFLKPTADKLGLPEQTVDDVVSFFYSAVRKSLTNLDGPLIQVENLGTFSTKVKKLPPLIEKHTAHLEKLNTPESFASMKLKKEIEQRLEKALSLKDKIDSEKQRKKEFLRKKNEQTGKDLGEQE